jgi:hypothetical protein
MKSMLGRNRYAFLNSKMEETHRVVVWWTPGAHHAYIFNKHGFCETKLSKARYATWLRNCSSCELQFLGRRADLSWLLTSRSDLL